MLLFDFNLKVSDYLILLEVTINQIMWGADTRAPLADTGSGCDQVTSGQCVDCGNNCFV